MRTARSLARADDTAVIVSLLLLLLLLLLIRASPGRVDVVLL